MNAYKKAVKFGIISTIAAIGILFLGSKALANGPAHSAGDAAVKFRQLGTELPTPNIYRNASGAPGPAYWQQRVNYVIDAALDEDKKRIIASETITYTNNSPDNLNYIWLALDQNRFKDGSSARMSEVASAAGQRWDKAGDGDSYGFSALRRAQGFADREYGFEFTSITDVDGDDLSFTINDSMMRIDLPEALAPEDQFIFTVDWEHNIVDRPAVGGRGGYEHFPENDTYIYALAQWFPRLAAYTDYTGWQNKQFLGRGEFTLEFGDYEVNLTVPSDHVVSASGVLQNPRQVMTEEQRSRLDEAGTKTPVYIITPEEAADNEKSKANGTKTWRFKADNVRDFAWSSSRKYIWDAMLFEQDDEQNPVVTAMSFYPNEADPIWSKYSTQAVVHTMDVYNKFAFNYPYPTAQSVNAWERGGMEYPMITFNGYRPTEDEKSGEVTYSRGVKYGLIGVIIHEIGHIYFPMTVNSDEREWTWMDEGINTFLEYMAEYEWEENFPIRRNMQNPLDDITRYMTSSNQVPIMTQSDSILQFGANAYAKPAAALIVLRETVMGREQFDYAFKEYSRRWRFKRPTPSDFFRTMEDASAVDLDWFWRGWFYTTDHVDIAIKDVREYQIATQDPDVENPKDRAEDAIDYPENIVQRRNRDEGRETRVNRFEDLNDFYNENDKFAVTPKDRKSYQSFLEGLSEQQTAAFERALEEGNHLYFIDFENLGGLISPLPLSITFENGDVQELMLPAELWRRSPDNVTKLLIFDQPVSSIELDKSHQTADADYSNNAFPPEILKSRLELYKSSFTRRDMMAEMMDEMRDEKEEGSESDEGVPLKSDDTDKMSDKAKRMKAKSMDSNSMDSMSSESDSMETESQEPESQEPEPMESETMKTDDKGSSKNGFYTRAIRKLLETYEK